MQYDWMEVNGERKTARRKKMNNKKILYILNVKREATLSVLVF